MKRHRFAVSLLALLGLSLGTSHAQKASKIENGYRISRGADIVEVQAVAANIARVDVKLGNRGDNRTPSMDPAFKIARVPAVKLGRGPLTIVTSQMTVTISEEAITFADPSGQLLTESDPVDDAQNHAAIFQRASEESIYGIHGIDVAEPNLAVDRNQGGKVAAGIQGDGGAPFFFTTHYGVFVDSDGGTFNVSGKTITFSGRSRNELEYFVVVGPPMSVMAGLADLTGHPQMPPKWTLGFLNSQWGLTENELRNIVQTYRSKHIALDGFILDFDWKAWGEDHYGEWRWNSTSSPENYDPNKFPNGASGKLANDMMATGVHLTGILKPRILLYKKDSTTEMHDSAAYAEEHKLWYPNEPVYKDYFTGREAKDLNFNLPETRTWIWKHLEPTFDSGIQGWWSDEADHTELLDKSDFRFDNYQFFNMGRMLYDGQRGHSNVRVWSLNRNFYVGAQRYAYAEWSGDFDTGFVQMQRQAPRMLAALNVGEPHWSMDTGGINGHPSDENYARWMEFAAFVPIFRVHCNREEKRQPWVFGPVAEAAAVHAIQMRYTLMPYIYSAERVAHETGIGVARPLLWAFPSDSNAASQPAEWMFGDGLLVAPVLEEHATQRKVYLPAGKWFDFATGQAYDGGQTIQRSVDAASWQDIPVFIREGAILAAQPPQEYADQMPVPEITLDVFPASTASSFVYYDDDGRTYDYEKGIIYRQQIQAIRSSNSDTIELQAPSGTFRPALKTFVIKVHGRTSKSVSLDGATLAAQSSAQELLNTTGTGWAASEDRFGPVTIVRVDAQRASKLLLQ